MHACMHAMWPCTLQVFPIKVPDPLVPDTVLCMRGCKLEASVYGVLACNSAKVQATGCHMKVRETWLVSLQRLWLRLARLCLVLHAFLPDCAPTTACH